MKSVTMRIVRAAERAFAWRGRVLADRYHMRILKTPREVRNAIRYVLLNARRHASSTWSSRGAGFDPASSGRWFDGWKKGTARVTVGLAHSWSRPRTPGPAKSGYKRSTRCGSRIEGRRPVRSGLPHRQAVWPTSTGTRRGRVFRTVSGVLPESVQHETRTTGETPRIIGPGLGSRFPGGAVAPTRGPVRAVVGLREADSRVRSGCKLRGSRSGL